METTDTIEDKRKTDAVEVDDNRGAWLPTPQQCAEAATLGRFRIPLSLGDRLRAGIVAELAGNGIIEGSQPELAYDRANPVPPAWQQLIDYLYTAGIAETPSVSFERLFHDEPKLFSLRLFGRRDPGRTDGYSGINVMGGYSRGVSPNFGEALSKAVGELLERYPLTIYRHRDFIRASERDLDRRREHHLAITDLAGFAPWQKDAFPKRRFSDTSLFSWVQGKELLSNEPALIPAQLVFWNYNFEAAPEEPYLRQPITNGAAGHFTREEAILAGIYENIQRDAFLIWWLNGRPPRRIDPDSIDDVELRSLIENIRRLKFEPVFLDTTLDLEVPSCICVLLDESGMGPKATVGGGCEPDLAKALVRSITEALGVYHWIREFGTTYALPEDYQPFRDPAVDQKNRLLLWGNPAMFDRLRPFISGRRVTFAEATHNMPAQSSSPEAELRRLLDMFRAKGRGYKVYLYEAQHPVLARLGYHSVRTVIPALVPLYLRETEAPLGASRIREVPIRYSFTAAKTPTPWPHPFP